MPPVPLRIVVCPILIAFASGCATVGDLQTIRQEVGTSVEEMKKELQAAKEANKQLTEQANEESKKELDLLREAVKTNYETGITETQKQVRLFSEELKQLKERQQRLLQGLNAVQDSVGKLSAAFQQAQQELQASRKQRELVLQEFQELRSSVQMTYGGVLDFLRIEEALLRASLERVKTILRGTDGVDHGPVHAREPAAGQPSPPGPPASPPSPASPPPSPKDAQESAPKTKD